MAVLTTKKNLADTAREAIVRELLAASAMSKNTLPKHIKAQIAAKYSCSTVTIGRVWHRAVAQGLKEGKMTVDMSSRIKGKVGRKTKLYNTADPLKTTTTRHGLFY